MSNSSLKPRWFSARLHSDVRQRKMKTIFTAFLVWVFVSQAFAAVNRRLVHVLEQLRQCTFTLREELPAVGGPAMGVTSQDHEFYLLYPYVHNVATSEDLKEMLRDPNPVVRIMGAKCLVNNDDPELRETVTALQADKAAVYVAPYGCTIYKSTVAEVIAALRADPNFLGDPTLPNRTGQRTGADARR